jgi:nucleoside-diphosphate-sugar epimerase
MTRVVLVTGASGRVGRALLPELRRAGWRTRALVHRRPVPGADEAAPGDLGDPSGLAAAAAGVGAVVHCAAATHARRAHTYDAVNLAGTQNLLRAVADAGVGHFLHVSTCAIDPAGGPYSRSKASAERLVAASGLPFTIVRLPELYGGDGPGLDAVVAWARRGRPIPVVGDGRYVVCPLAVGEAAATLAGVLGRTAAGLTYTLSGECTTVREFAETCARLAGGRSRVVGVPVAAVAVLSALARVAPLPLYPDQLAQLRSPKCRDADDARRDLGFQAQPLVEGLRRYLP